MVAESSHDAGYYPHSGQVVVVEAAGDSPYYYHDYGGALPIELHHRVNSPVC